MRVIYVFRLITCIWVWRIFSLRAPSFSLASSSCNRSPVNMPTAFYICNTLNIYTYVFTHIYIYIYIQTYVDMCVSAYNGSKGTWLVSLESTFARPTWLSLARVDFSSGLTFERQQHFRQSSVGSALRRHQADRGPLSIEYGTCKTFTARFWPCLPGKRP